MKEYSETTMPELEATEKEQVKKFKNTLWNSKYFIETKKDSLLSFGAILIVLSSGLFFLGLLQPSQNEDVFNVLFFIHYALPMIYWISLMILHKNSAISLFGEGMLRHHSLLLILFNLSAYALNRNLPIFQESADWLCGLLIIENALLFAIALVVKPNKLLSKVIMFCMPIFFLFHFHQVLMIGFMYIVGLIGSVFLGIGLLVTVPIFYVVAWSNWLYKSKELRAYDSYVIPSSILTLGTIVAFVLFWQGMDEKVRDKYLDAQKPLTQIDLPVWVSLAKELKDNWLTEAYLKGDFVYQTYERNSSFGFGRRFEEKRIHDPLVMIGMGLTDDNPLDTPSRLKILESMYDKRHNVVDRFWSGDHLVMDQVVTNVELFQEERLSYTELLLTIANRVENRTWSQEEAIFTFQLPEGAVITSLSLWIAGKEEKGILTTKSKAKKAYNTIVGRERRDPSVIYWMEGNKARIRVFPCTPKEDRLFKLGVTAPLSLQNNELVYTPISFKGPKIEGTSSAINIVNNGFKPITNLSLEKQDKLFSWQGTYSDNWKLSIPKEDFKVRSFQFKDEIFEVKQTQEKIIDFEPTTVYLDISSHWTTSEIEELKEITEGKYVVILENNSENKEGGEFPNFTLFPYYQIIPSTSVVITKGGIPTPNLEDLKGTSFRESLFSHLAHADNKALVLDFGEIPTEYNRSLHELGGIHLEKVEIADIKQYFETGRFPSTVSNNHVVDLEGNQLSIHNVENSDAPKGSDHLMRLFYYQKIMQQIGKSYFGNEADSLYEEELTTLAAKANIVTPVSSLIVLESQQDYERFGIKKNKDSLGNASINGSGAVPEPHEWALIIIGGIFLIVLYIKNKTALI